MPLTLVTDIDFPGKHTYIVSAIARTLGSNVATVTTAATNALATGQTVTLSGMQPATYNGDFVITVTDGTHFTVTVPEATLSVSALTQAAGVATATTATAHGYATGDKVTIGGADQAGYNLSSATITVTSTTQFTYAVDPATVSPATGTVSCVRELKANAAVSVASITRSGATATVTTSTAHGYSTGDTVTIAGATQTEYNLTTQITVTSTTAFTYAVATTPATPATGTITSTRQQAAYGGTSTVPGIVFLDSYFFVMTEEAKIFNSALRDGASWDALEFIEAMMEPGKGKALAKSGAYVIAMKEWSTEFFYDAANAVGSPLSAVQNGFTLVGCASGHSVVNLDGTLFWLSQTKERGRSVHKMVGLEQEKLSTADIERVLNASDLSTVYSYGIKIAGHAFYLLTLKDIDITLVYDITTKTWVQWTSLTARAAAAVTSLVRTDQTVTVTTTAPHNLADGDPVTISGATPSDYNGRWNVTVTGASTFTFPVEGAPTTPATGSITYIGYDETYFKFSHYVFCNGRDLVLHETNGHLYEVLDTQFSDASDPINMLVRTGKLDFDSTDNKTLSKAEVIGNKIPGLGLVRWSDDDYNTFSTYRRVDLNATRSQLRRCGDFRRRSFDIKYTGDTSCELAALELEVSGGK